MKKLLIYSVVLVVGVLAVYLLAPQSSVSPREDYEHFLNHHPFAKILAAAREESEEEGESEGENEADSPEKALLQDYLRTMDPAIKSPTPLVLLPLNERTAGFRDGKQVGARTQATSLSTATVWTERGPSTVGGRTRALMFDPNDPTNKKVWAAGVSGGLWYNGDITSATSSWKKVDDLWDNLAISCIASDPVNKNIFYVGTGELEWIVRGGGIWKTSNGGSTWTRLTNTQNFLEVRDIVVRNENGVGVVYAGVKPGFGKDNPTYSGGLFRSADGGITWAQVLPLAQGSTQYTNLPTDIAIAADNSIWVGTAKHFWETGANSTIYKSSTGLAGSWTAMSAFTASNLKFTGQIQLGIAPSNPSTVYAAIEEKGKIGGIFISTNAGTTWSGLTLPVAADTGIPVADFTRGQAFWDLTLGVHPTDPNTCLIGGVDLYMTSNAGGAWTQISKWSNGPNMNTLTCSLVHADQHTIIFRPNFPNEVAVANDGGVFYATNITTSATSSVFGARNLNYNVTQFYSAALHPTLSNFMLGGTQDNGTPKFTLPGFGTTVDVYGGDGAMCFIDQLTPNYQIASYTYNVIGLSSDGGNTFNTKLIDDNKNGNFINVGDYDNNLKALFTARSTTAIYRVSNVTTTRDVDSIKMNLGTMASAFRVSPYSTTVSNLYVGTQAGRLFKVAGATSAGPVITELTGPLFGTGSISCISFGASESQMIVTFFNYGVINIWETRNGGGTWVNREGNLPNMPVRWAEYHPQSFDQAYIATELGVWSTDNINVSSPVWTSTNGGLANVRTDMLRVRKKDGTLMASTHGRGVFTALIPSNLDQTLQFPVIAKKTFGDPSFKINVKASSSLPITSLTSSNPSILSITDSTATIKGAGTVTLTTTQSGNAVFKAATMDQSLTVNKAANTITFTTIPTKTLGDPAFDLTVTSNSTLPISLSVNNDKVTFSGSQVTIVKAGSVTINADQSGNANYNAATRVSQTFCVNPTKPLVAVSGADPSAPLLTSNATSGNQWFLNGTTLAGGNIPAITVSAPGIYKVQVTIDQCSSAFSEDRIYIITGDRLASAGPLKIIIYPNPASDWIAVTIPESEGKKTVAVYQMDGKRLDFIETMGYEARFSIKEYPEGPYLLQVVTQKGNQVERFVRKQD